MSWFCASFFPRLHTLCHFAEPGIYESTQCPTKGLHQDRGQAQSVEQSLAVSCNRSGNFSALLPRIHDEHDHIQAVELTTPEPKITKSEMCVYFVYCCPSPSYPTGQPNVTLKTPTQYHHRLPRPLPSGSNPHHKSSTNRLPPSFPPAVGLPTTSPLSVPPACLVALPAALGGANVSSLKLSLASSLSCSSVS